MAGYQVQVVKVEDNGNVSMSDLKMQVKDLRDSATDAVAQFL